MNKPSAQQLAAMLFLRHSHAEEAYDINPDQIIYTEASVINLLRELGYDEPVFEGEEYLKFIAENIITDK